MYTMSNDDVKRILVDHPEECPYCETYTMTPTEDDIEADGKQWWLYIYCTRCKRQFRVRLVTIDAEELTQDIGFKDD
jgi:hypothetical protein